MIGKIETVAVYVDDQPESLRFWTGMDSVYGVGKRWFLIASSNSSGLNPRGPRSLR